MAFPENVTLWLPTVRPKGHEESSQGFTERFVGTSRTVENAEVGMKKKLDTRRNTCAFCVHEENAEEGLVLPFGMGEVRKALRGATGVCKMVRGA